MMAGSIFAPFDPPFLASETTNQLQWYNRFGVCMVLITVVDSAVERIAIDYHGQALVTLRMM